MKFPDSGLLFLTCREPNSVDNGFNKQLKEIEDPFSVIASYGLNNKHYLVIEKKELGHGRPKKIDKK